MKIWTGHLGPRTRRCPVHPLFLKYLSNIQNQNSFSKITMVKITFHSGYTVTFTQINTQKYTEIPLRITIKFQTITFLIYYTSSSYNFVSVMVFLSPPHFIILPVLNRSYFPVISFTSSFLIITKPFFFAFILVDDSGNLFVLFCFFLLMMLSTRT